MLCARYQEWMIPAALGGLPPARARELDAHLQACAACRAEFARAHMLSSAIDRGLAAAVNVQPSPQLAARVRSEISRMPAPPLWPFARWVPFAAAALAAVALAALLLRPRVPPNTTGVKPVTASARSVSQQPPPEPFTNLLSPRRTHRASSPRIRNAPQAPEVLVPPGEWSATVRFALAVGRGRVNAAELIAAAEKSRKPLNFARLEIQPIVIAPLSDVSQAPLDGAGANNR